MKRASPEFGGANLSSMARKKGLKEEMANVSGETTGKVGRNTRQEMVGVKRIKEHPHNVNRGDEVAIADSIRANGFYRALVVQRSTGFVLAGNHSFRVGVRDFGLKEFPVIWFDGDEETARRILLADNRTAGLASYDEEALLAELKSLASLEGTGFDARDVQKIEEKFRVPPVPEEPPPTKTQFVKTCPKCGHQFS